MFRKQFTKLQNACAFAEAIVNTVREPLVVLDQDLRVVAASRSFYRTFKVNPEAIDGKLLFELDDGVWDIPKLRSLLEKILPADGAIEAGAIEAYEIERDFPGIGRRTMCLNARKVLYETGSRANILLGIEDITERLILEGEKDDLLRQKDILLEELQHRVANSLQIIASIIMMKARAVEWKKRGVICRKLISASCRLQPCSSNFMPLRPARPSNSSLILRSFARLWDSR